MKGFEKPLEMEVSKYLYSLSFTVLEVPGPSFKGKDRALIEENTIALLSNYKKDLTDKHSPNWLGLHSGDEKVVLSGIWNSKHVDQTIIDERYFEPFDKHLCNMLNWY